jgi:hypothetical protein
MDKLKRISAEIKDSIVQKEFTNKFITEMNMMLNHCWFGDSLKIVRQIESECTSNIKAYYHSAWVYLAQEDWAIGKN